MHSIYFARHGETVWNVENKICGMTDSPSPKKGRQQARELGQKVKGKRRPHRRDIVLAPEPRRRHRKGRGRGHRPARPL